MIDLLGYRQPKVEPSPANAQRARWVVDLGLAMDATLTTGQRLQLLNAFYDRAREEGGTRVIDRILGAS